MKKIANIRLDTSKGFFVQPIGEISSCYRQCIGTPRQGLLVPASRATITLTKNISSEAIEGLQDFSHVWITFKFHLNSNTLKESKAFSSRATFNGKITLPMLKKKLGVFATRSPHRPNPIGVTLAQIRGVDKKKHQIYLHGCDLVQGTPVLDIKPYVPAYDTVESFRIPSWIEETVFSRNEVTILPQCKAYIQKVQGRLKQYHNDPQQYLQALEETLAAEVRSKFQTQKQMEFTAKGELVYVLFDETVVKYRWLSERSFEVVDILLTSEDRQLVSELLKVLPPSSNEEEDENDLVSEPLKLIESLKTHSGEDVLEGTANETREHSFDPSQLKPLLSNASKKDEEVAACLPSSIGDINSNGQKTGRGLNLDRLKMATM
eukprot:scaffold801_cov178-Ochromonas_danica.AAC.8